MGALHLAEVHQAPEPPKRKRKGGGGGSEFYEFATRIYADDRADSPARELLLAFAYAATTAPGDAHGQWDLVIKALSHRSRVAELIRRDAPRYVAPWNLPGGDSRVCCAPRLRPYRTYLGRYATPALIAEWAKRDEQDFRNVRKICGESAPIRIVEKLPGTGWYREHRFCKRHTDHAERVREQVREQNEFAPEPIPNAGGLLPSYFDSDWERIYRFYLGERWKPPVYGLRADDWPIPGKDPVPMRARLRLAAADGVLLGGVS